MAKKKLTHEQIRAKQRAWEAAYRERNAEAIRQRQRDRYAQNIEAERAKRRESQRRNYDPERNRLIKQRHIDKIGLEAKRARQRAWYAKNRDAERARTAAAYQKHKEKRLTYSRQYEADNRLDRREKTRRWAVANKEQQLAYRLAHREEAAARSAAFEAQNHENRRIRHNERQASDPNYRLRRALRAAIARALRKRGLRAGKAKIGSAITLLGCTVEQLRRHLERQFKAGMSWENYGGRTGWQVDHIRELATFDLRDATQFAHACHYTNLQPLPRFDNISKGSRVRWGTGARGLAVSDQGVLEIL